MSALWAEDNGHRLVTGLIVEVDGDQGTVQVPSFDDGLSKFGPCSLPAGASEGDACLVAFDENNLAWVISAGGGGGGIVEQVTAATAAVEDLQEQVDALTARKIVHGRVSSAGAVVGGSGGFSAAKNSSGDYTVTFSPAFSGVPTVTLGLGSTSTNPRGIKLKDGVPATAGAFTVWTYTVAPTLVDSEFHFIAIGNV